jgi:hypothetical protein
VLSRQLTGGRPIAEAKFDKMCVVKYGGKQAATSQAKWQTETTQASRNVNSTASTSFTSLGAKSNVHSSPQNPVVVHSNILFRPCFQFMISPRKVILRVSAKETKTLL